MDELLGRLRKKAIVEIRKGYHWMMKDSRGRGGNRRVTTEIKLPLSPEIDFNIETLGTLLKKTSRSEKRVLNHNQIVNWLQLPELIHDAACGGSFRYASGAFHWPYAFSNVIVESAIVTHSPKGLSPFVKVEFKSYIPEGEEYRMDDCTFFADHPFFGKGPHQVENPHRYLVSIQELEQRRIEHREYHAREKKDEASFLRFKATRRERLDQLIANGQAWVLC